MLLAVGGGGRGKAGVPLETVHFDSLSSHGEGLGGGGGEEDVTLKGKRTVSRGGGEGVSSGVEGMVYRW